MRKGERVSRRAGERRRWRRRAVGLAPVALLLPACGRDEVLPQNVLDPEGPVARQVHELATPVFWIAGLVFVLVQALLIYSVVRFRRRSDADAPVQVHGNAKAEIGWTIAPAAVLAVVGVLTVGTIVDLDRVPEGEDVLRVNVVGRQWWWHYEYPDHGVTTANELHIPTNTKVAITLTSDDVIHSFWPPKLAGKVDVIPGRVNHMVIEASDAGTYYGQCGEFCGISHANMRLQVIAHPPAEFDRWVRSNARPAALPGADQPEAAAGAALFRQRGCASCHTVEGYAAGEIGPDLTHFAQRTTFAGAIFENNPKNLRRWLRNPPEEKPGSIMPDLDLTEEDITNLIAYLETLK